MCAEIHIGNAYCNQDTNKDVLHVKMQKTTKY